MKKHVSFYIISTLLAAMLLLIIGCNTDTEGVFTRIRNSKVKVDVGTVDILGMDASKSKVYAFTSRKGMQSYTIATERWESLGLNVENLGLYSTDSPTSATEIYYALRDDNGINPLYTYIIGASPPGTVNNSYKILEMKPQHNLMLVDDGDDSNYKVFTADGLSEKASLSKSNFNDIPRLVSFDSTNFIVSGTNTSDAVVHYICNSTNITLITNITSPIVGMLVSGTNYALIDSTGKVWTKTNGTIFSHDSANVVPSFPSREPENIQYPTFVHSDKLYLQNETNTFYKVTSGGAVSSVTTTYSEELKNIKVKSYLVDGTTLYAGTDGFGILDYSL
jgi:hypothetical protein